MKYNNYSTECLGDEYPHYIAANRDKSAAAKPPRRSGSAFHAFTALVKAQGRDLNEPEIGWQWSWFQAGWGGHREG